jgi:ectoine hydroxylase-related dioxygenase (phytanoyl-CoA dioxygenase family)
MDAAIRDKHVEAIRRDGYTVVENAIARDLVDALSGALARLERDLAAVPAGNGFEGHRTVRIYNLLAHGAPFAEVPVHANVLPIVEGVLDEGCLISSLSSIAIDPGETAQPIHADDQVIPLEKPHADPAGPRQPQEAQPGVRRRLRHHRSGDAEGQRAALGWGAVARRRGQPD